MNRFKLKEGRFRADTRRKFFAVRMVRHWKGCPKRMQISDAPSLEVLHTELQVA